MSADRDPVVVWLEEIRDFAGATDRAREMAQQAIDRLAPAEPRKPGDDAIDRIVESAAAENAHAGRSIADKKIERITDAAREETERGRQARRQP